MDRKVILVGLISFLLIAAVAAGVFLLGRPDTLRGTTYAEPYPVAAEFELTRADGNRFRLSDERGKVVMLFFGYTSCPDVCPTTMAELKQALEKVGEKADQVQVIYVTVDPERDTPERVQEYVNHFQNIGLSGRIELAEVWNGAVCSEV
jgi:protein SCO1/2